MFDRVNPLGWALYEELTSAQMNLLDTYVSRAIDGTFGGTYNPSNPIIINGTLTVTNLTNENGTFTNLTVSGTIDANAITAHSIDALNVFYSRSTTLLYGVTYEYGDFYMVGTGKNFNFFTGGLIDVTNGTLIVRNGGIAQFETDVTFTSTATVVVAAGCDWDFNNLPSFNGGFNAYGAIAFHSKPSFYEGLVLPAGKLIEYSTAKSWIVRCPWALGHSALQDQSTNGVWKFGGYGSWRQVANSSYAWFWTNLQGLWGGTAVTITAGEFHKRAVGTSGTPTGTTSFALYVLDEDMNVDTTVSVTDTGANDTTDTYCAFSSQTVAYNPLTQMLAARFNGYFGGNTLSDSVYYQLNAIRLTLQTNAKGIY